MKVLIVDDESPARDRLRELLSRLADYQVCAEACHGAEALRLAASHTPDIVLLDIQMPGLNGLETARRLAESAQPPAIIFITAYDEYALAAFEAHAVAYLLKPIRVERLEHALTKASRLNRAQVASLVEQPTTAGRTHIHARIGQRLERILFSDVFYFQADQKYVTVRHRQGQVLIEESLKVLEAELGTRALRVHRNALVMSAQIAGLEKSADSGYILLFHAIPDRLEVSRRHLTAIRQFLRRA
ncbi:MAG: LytTR family DNA-binding domain-containing protein [Candidatus Contendobacter sp.]